ncbi:MAG TPA: hypothetical protein VGR16_05880, partial [Thermomicrobiales bacterium]|nr:hypothetical protein [Thermomicrobiales bacterium]
MRHSDALPRGSCRDLRERRVQAVASGASRDPGTSPGGPREIGADADAALRVQVVAHPDAMLAVHCPPWAADGHAVVREATRNRVRTR